jgi:predicted metal-binding membrane protein
MSAQQTSVAPAAPTWWTRENLVTGIVLLIVTALAWSYTLQGHSVGGLSMPHPAGAMAGMDAMGGMHAGMEMPAGGASAGGTGRAPPLVQPAGIVLFLFGWTVMMAAMMLPAALPLILLYRAIARKRFSLSQTAAGIGALLAGYLGVWAFAGLPVFGYSYLSASWGPAMAVLPGMLLIAGGVYQFTALKHGCHTRCSSPLFFLTRQGRPGITGATRLGVLHGIDCLGCCVGLMLALVGLGMMNVAWMLTAAVIIFVEKTLPGGHRVARPLGVALVLGGVLLLGSALFGNG